MQRILAHKTVSLTELRDPAKVLTQAGSSTVAVLNRNHVVGYFVPKAAVDQVKFEYAGKAEVLGMLKQSRNEVEPILDYLKDK